MQEPEWLLGNRERAGSWRWRGWPAIRRSALATCCACSRRASSAANVRRASMQPAFQSCSCVCSLGCHAPWRQAGIRSVGTAAGRPPGPPGQDAANCERTGRRVRCFWVRDAMGATVSVPPAQTWDPRFAAPSDTTPGGPNPAAAIWRELKPIPRLLLSFITDPARPARRQSVPAAPSTDLTASRCMAERSRGSRRPARAAARPTARGQGGRSAR